MPESQRDTLIKYCKFKEEHSRAVLFGILTSCVAALLLVILHFFFFLHVRNTIIVLNKIYILGILSKCQTI